MLCPRSYVHHLTDSQKKKATAKARASGTLSLEPPALASLLSVPLGWSGVLFQWHTACEGGGGVSILSRELMYISAVAGRRHVCSSVLCSLIVIDRVQKALAAVTGSKPSNSERTPQLPCSPSLLPVYKLHFSYSLDDLGPLLLHAISFILYPLQHCSPAGVAAEMVELALLEMGYDPAAAEARARTVHAHDATCRLCV